MLSSILAITAIALSSGLLLGYASRFLAVKGNPVVDQIADLLPQTQCGQCGFAGCAQYAAAIAAGDAEINRCGPAGEAGVTELANLLGREVIPLDEEATEKSQEELVAVVDEQVCIGCTKCIQACPVDAIVGAAKLMHTIIESDCTGCELCVDPCPVDCISMIPPPSQPAIERWYWPRPENRSSATAVRESV